MSAEPADHAAADRAPAGWFVYALVGLVAMSAAAVALDWYYHHLLPYRWGPKAHVSMEQLHGDDMTAAYGQLALTGRIGGAYALAAVAGVLALALGLADALTLRRPVSFVLAPVGAAVAAGAGAGGGYLAMYIHQRLTLGSSLPTTMTEAIMLQATAWLCAGLGIALAVWMTSLGRRRFIETAVGGLLAGGLVGILYPVVTSAFYPDQNTDRLFPDNNYFASVGDNTTAFLFWVVFTGTLFAGVLGAVGRRKAKVLAGPPAPTTGP